MHKRTLGKNGPLVSAMGLGCMGMSEFYGQANEKESKKVLFAALEQGINMLDTADMYGAGHNEQLVGSVIKEWKNEVFVATKFGIVRKEGSYERTINGRPEYVKQACEASLKRLGLETIDLYYYHRVDASTPIEETVGAMADLVKEGKIRHIGLSEVSENTLRKAHEVFPVTAVQTEYSLWTRDVENTILDTLRELGIALVPYSPLSRGFLSGKLTKQSMEQDGDFRKFLPRVQEENYEHNMSLVKKLEELGKARGVTPAQLALAWVLAAGDDVVPIPGTKRLSYLKENIKAADILLSKEEMSELNALFTPGSIRGERYPEAGMVGING